MLCWSVRYNTFMPTSHVDRRPQLRCFRATTPLLVAVVQADLVLLAQLFVEMAHVETEIAVAAKRQPSLRLPAHSRW
jgi:hypothetical protein